MSEPSSLGMESQRLGNLKERFRFDEWSGASGREVATYISRIEVSRELLAPWRLRSTQEHAVEGFPRTLRSLWRSDSAQRDEAVTMVLYECGSSPAAREFLLELLERLRSPRVERLQGSEAVGDVAFSEPGQQGILFAKANVVVAMKSTGRDPVPTLAMARQVDAFLGQQG